MRESDLFNSNESKVTYLDGGQLRSIRGVIIAEDELFLVLRRRDGELRISKRLVEKIEQWG